MNAVSRASRVGSASSPEATNRSPSGSSPADLHLPAPRRASARVHPAQVYGPSSGRPPRGATTLFEVPFESAMSDLDLALLERMLDLSIRIHAKIHPRPDSPGFIRLDHYSGLFLERGAAEGQWMRQARTWGHPAPGSVHEWHVLAADAAHQLDPTVTLPERLSACSPRNPGPSTRTSSQETPCRLVSIFQGTCSVRMASWLGPCASVRTSPLGICAPVRWKCGSAGRLSVVRSR
jgi:hypothetical protein